MPVRLGQEVQALPRAGGLGLPSRPITIRGDVDAAITNTSKIVEDTGKRVLPEPSERQPGVRLSFEGQAKESATTGSPLRRRPPTVTGGDSAPPRMTGYVPGKKRNLPIRAGTVA